MWCVMAKQSLADREKALLEKIQNAKNDLAKLQKKQKEDIGNLAYKYRLNELDMKELEKAFKKISDELIGGN